MKILWPFQAIIVRYNLRIEEYPINLLSSSYCYMFQVDHFESTLLLLILIQLK